MAQPPAPRRSQGGSLITRGPHPLDIFRRQFDDLFDRMWSSMLAPFGQDVGAGRGWGFDVDQTDKEVVVRADVPGFEEKELDVRLDNDVLTIQAEKEQKGVGQQQYRSFYRSVSLPPGVDAEKAQATYRNGVLELHFPRPEGSRAKRIAVQGEPASRQAPASKAGNGSPGQQAAQKAKA
jgi:HSP20 family protein